jgi:hypothetical protein
MNNLIKIEERKNIVTSLELVEQINIFRSQEDNRSELQHKDLLKVIRDEFEDEIGEGKISLGSYKDKQNQERPMFELTFNQARQVLVRESKFVRKHIMSYIEELEKQLGNIISYEDRLKLGLFSNDPDIVARSHKALLKLELKPLKEELEYKTKEIEYKEDVIIGLTDKIELMDMRQILNTVVRYKGADFQERWRLLYFEFERKYHVDIKRRIENYNKNNKPKLKNKLEYIDKIMNKLPQLYEIACKLFEGDIEQIIENYKKVC